MPTSFKLFAVPLDGSDPASKRDSFFVSLVCNLEFPQGRSRPTDIAEAVAVHPLLHGDVAPRLNAFALGYDAWQAAGQVVNAGTPGAIPVSLSYAGKFTPTQMRDTLAKYLFRSDSIDVAQLSPDARFDALVEDGFLDVVKLHDDLTMVRSELHERAVGRFGFARNLSIDKAPPDNFSYAQARWINAHVQTQLIDAIYALPGVRALAVGPEASQALDRVRTAVAQVQRRLIAKTPNRAAPQPTLRSATQAGETDVSPQDPNVSMHAALKNSTLAEACGIVTLWQAKSRDPLEGDFVIAIDVTGLAVDRTVADVATQTTAFRRRGHTHPLSYVDLGRPRTTNGGLALLNDENGNPRYRGTAIHAETAAVQATILQANNSISNSSPNRPITPTSAGDAVGRRDDRPPQILGEEHFGSNELESGGLTISAPVEDLMTPRPLADPDRTTVLPCLFLEDLWVGFKLDISGASGQPLRSIHKQTVEITFRASGAKIHGESEGFFAREQWDPTKDVTSTEICRYVGLSAAQAQDYMRFLGNYEEPEYPEPPPFAVRVTGYSGATRLLFGKVYSYRLRNVFLGGISFRDDDPGLVAFAQGYTQTCPFFRARGFRPGEIVSFAKQQSDSPGAAGRTVFLSDRQPRASVWVVPAPIDSDTARYHGVFLADSKEPLRNSHRAFVTDITKFFQSHGSKAQYYLDPDVNEIIVQVTMLNGDPKNLDRQFAYRNGSYCELVKHYRLSPVRARFGAVGQWEKFRPIQIIFQTTSDPLPRATPSVGQTRVLITVPPAADIEVSLLPVVSQENVRRSATYAASTLQLARRVARGASDAPLSPVPAIVEQKLRVVHCPERPTITPVLNGEKADVEHGSTLPAQREKGKATAELNGYLQLDAASTGQIRLEASWSDIDDSPQHRKYLFNAATNVSAPRSINFVKYNPPSAASIARTAPAEADRLLREGPYSLSELFGLQCAENKLFLGTTVPNDAAPTSARTCVLDFGDSRRKQATVAAVAIGRYTSQFKNNQASYERRSGTSLVEVPASMRLSAPDISHVVPLSRKTSEGDDANRRSRSLYAMRIYVRRPWFQSGPCERLAIGCATGQAEDGPIASPDKFVTQWGEDPIERPKLEITRRRPRASDFGLLTFGSPPEFDSRLYPRSSIEGNSPVLYRDNIARLEGNSAHNVLSVASYALRWDDESRLWFCDVQASGEFLGWCGLALYRHQPHAHEGVQVSETPAWVYGAVLHGETVAWLKRNGQIHITVGPVYDRYTSFELDATEFRKGVSRDIRKRAGRRVALQKYVANGHTYFEGRVDGSEAEWSLMKVRFGGDVASLPLRGGA
jgi:hypothetical protein